MPHNTDSDKARESYLDSLPLDEQAHVLRHAEKHGPLPSDSDWLVAYASQQAAARIESLISAFEARTAPAMKKQSIDAGRTQASKRTPERDLFSFALSLITFAGVAYFVERYSAHSQSLILYSIAIALGVAGALFYCWLNKRLYQ